MVPEEAKIVFALLEDVSDAKILNLCSGGEHFWRKQQPYIWSDLLLPLKQNGNRITNLDFCELTGVDIVDDCTNMVDVADSTFDIVLFNSAVEHILDPHAALSEIRRVIKPDGKLIASAPGVFPKHDAPVDTLLRLPELGDWINLLGSGWIVDDFRRTMRRKPRPLYRFDGLVFTTVVVAHCVDEYAPVSLPKGLEWAKSVPVISAHDYLTLYDRHQAHFDHLEQIVTDSGATLEGNCFYKNLTLEREPALFNKQRNLVSVARSGKNIMEIGFNAGHSTLLFLLANPEAKVTCFDLCSHAYTPPAFDYLSRSFPGRLEMFAGDSNVSVADFHDSYPGRHFDLIHIDGGHRLDVAHRDFINCRKLATEDSIVIFDDVDILNIGKLWFQYAMQGFVVPFGLLPTPKYTHAFGVFSRLHDRLPERAAELIGSS